MLENFWKCEHSLVSWGDAKEFIVPYLHYAHVQVHALSIILPDIKHCLMEKNAHSERYNKIAWLDQTNFIRKIKGKYTWKVLKIWWYMWERSEYETGSLCELWCGKCAWHQVKYLVGILTAGVNDFTSFCFWPDAVRYGISHLHTSCHLIKATTQQSNHQLCHSSGLGFVHENCDQ